MEAEQRLLLLEAAALHERSAEVLLAGLDDPEPLIRRRSVALVARHVDPMQLVALVRDGARADRRNAARMSLLRQVPVSVAAARLLCEDADPDAVIVGIEIIAAARDGAAVERMLELSKHSDPNVATAALEALGAFPAERVIERLLTALHDPGFQRLAATSALGALGDERAVGPLIEQLRAPLHRDVCVRALGQIGSMRALEPLVELGISTTRRRTLEQVTCAVSCIALRSEQALWAAAPALSRLATSPKHAELLALLRGSDPALSRAAGLVLMARGGEDIGAEVLAAGHFRESPAVYRHLLARQSLGHLPALLAHRDARVRAHVLEVCGAGDVGIAELLRATDDVDTTVRSAALAALGRLDDARATQRLLECLVQGDAELRALAAEALTERGDRAADAFVHALGNAGSDEARAAILACAPSRAVATFRHELCGWAAQRLSALRLAAVRAAARLEHDDGHPILHEALSDSDACVSAAAAEALACAGRVSDILVCLSQPSLVRFRLIASLAKPGLHAAVQPLLGLYASAPRHEQVEIVSALGSIGGEKALLFLAQLAGDPDGSIRRVAAESVAQRATQQDVALLLRFARDPEWAVRRWAVEGLSRLEGDAAHAALLELARDTDDLVASLARASLIGTVEVPA